MCAGRITSAAGLLPRLKAASQLALACSSQGEFQIEKYNIRATRLFSSFLFLLESSNIISMWPRAYWRTGSWFSLFTSRLVFIHYHPNSISWRDGERVPLYCISVSSDRIYTCANLCGLVTAYILACSLVQSDNVSTSILNEKLCWWVNLLEKSDYQTEVSTTYRGPVYWEIRHTSNTCFEFVKTSCTIPYCRSSMFTFYIFREICNY